MKIPVMIQQVHFLLKVNQTSFSLNIKANTFDDSNHDELIIEESQGERYLQASQHRPTLSLIRLNQ